MIQSPAIREASGLAVSRRNDGLFWLINDSGAKPELHLLETSGRDRGKVVLSGAENVDWEDLASFVLGKTAYLLVADAGDNQARRGACVLYVLREPELPPDGKSLGGSIRTEWEIRFCYEGGPRDCEAVAVDTASGRVLLLSKRDAPPQLFELPLKPADLTAVQVARRTAEVRVQGPADKLLAFATQPTGLDITADGSLAAIVTYYGVYLIPRNPDEPWAGAFARMPVPLGPHRLPQAEAVAFSRNGAALLVTSEGRNPAIACYRRVKSAAKP